MAAKKKRTVDDVLAERRARRLGSLGTFTEDQLAQVKRALEINDAQPNMMWRVSSKEVCQLLIDEYGYSYSRPTFERMMCAAFGRKSWNERG